MAIAISELAQKTVVQSENGVVGDMHGEKVMLGLHTGKYYNLRQIGGRIWELLAVPVAVSRLVDVLIVEYDVRALRMRAAGCRLSSNCIRKP